MRGEALLRKLPEGEKKPGVGDFREGKRKIAKVEA